MTAPERVTLLSVTLAGCSGGATPAAPAALTTAPSIAGGTAGPPSTIGASTPGAPPAQAAPPVSTASGALIVGALEPQSFSGLAGSISASRFRPDGKALNTLKSKAGTRDFNLRTIAFSPGWHPRRQGRAATGRMACSRRSTAVREVGSILFEVVVTPFDGGFEHGAPTPKLLTLARAAASHL